MGCHKHHKDSQCAGTQGRHLPQVRFTYRDSLMRLSNSIFCSHDNILPCWQVLPEFLAETKYQNPSDAAHSPFQKGHRTELMPFDWALAVPSRFDNFLQWMMANREGQKMFLDVYPFEKELCHGLTPETPLFVDVGGGIGHMCLALKQRLPHAPGRVVNQDLPPAIAQAIQSDGVEHTIHDFMTDQPIKGRQSLDVTSLHRATAF